MCIVVVNPAFVKTGRLQLWKVIRPDNEIGIWGETHYANGLKFQIGKNVAHNYLGEFYDDQPAQFHCFFSRKDARRYIKYQREERPYYRTIRRKIIKVYANSEDVVSIGVDKLSYIPAVSVSKMKIKSLKHQR